MENKPISPKMDEFLSKVDKLCFEYDYEILPNDEQTIVVIGKDESIKLLYIDGDGRGN